MTSAKEPQAKRTPSPEPIKALILIVDDDEDLRGELVGLLRVQGLRAEGAPEGIAGFSLSTKLDPDVIVLDVGLPLVDGFKVGQKLKQDPRTAHIPILFLTTTLDEETRVSGLSMLGCEYLSKPFSQREFLSKIENLSQRKALQERLMKGSPREKTAATATPPIQTLPADKDPLTGLPTWASIRQRLEEEIVRADRHKIPYVFLVLGIDNLAEIARTFGKDFVRDIYRGVADRVRKRTRRYNIVGHFGEALFSITFFQCEMEEGRIGGERLRADIEAHEFRHASGRVATTVTIGMCYLPPEELAILRHEGVDVIQTVLRKARQSLLQGQAEGGNRVVLSEPTIIQARSA